MTAICLIVLISLNHLQFTDLLVLVPRVPDFVTENNLSVLYNFWATTHNSHNKPTSLKGVY